MARPSIVHRIADDVPALKLAKDQPRIGPIERDIPIPPQRRGTPGSPVRLAIAELAVGESRCFVGASRQLIHSTTSDLRRRSGHRYSTRQVDGGFRVWRVE